MKYTYVMAGHKIVECSVQGAVESSLDETHRQGELEQLKEKVRNCAQAIGHICEYLANNQTATRDDLREMLSNIVSYRFTLKED